MAKLIQHGVVAPLARNCSYPDDKIGLNALTALLHLSSRGTTTAQCVEDLISNGGLNRMTEICLSAPTKNTAKDDDWRKRVNLALAIMANMTRTERGAIEFVGKSLPDEAIPVVATSSSSNDDTAVENLPPKPTLHLMLERFLNSQYVETEDVNDDNNQVYEEEEEQWSSRHNDPYQHLAGVLMNATHVEGGRRFVLKIHRKDDHDVGSSVLQRILHQLRSSNPIRRRGIAGTIRNCCLETDNAWWLLHVVKLTTHVLYPLAGPEELDLDEKKGLDPDLWLEGPEKKREMDHLTRLYLVESILLLCASGRKSRETLRLERVYVILKWADMVEEHEDVSERINECVQYIRRDEQGTQEGSSDKMVEDSLNNNRPSKKPLLLPPSTTQQVGSNEDYDDVD